MNKVFVGFPVTYLLMSLAIFLSSIASGRLRTLGDLVASLNSSLFLPFATIAASLICTLGISLVLWIPIWWVVGSITIALAPRLADILNRARPEATSVPTTVQSASPSQLAIANYIKKAEDRGLSDRAIANRLTANGWTEEEIELARGLANVESQRNGDSQT